jgi:prefoldin beta subunit
MENQENNLQEIQFLEQNLQNIIYQKQAFQMEISETESALEETKKSGEDVYKIIGQLMIKTDKAKVEKELQEKQGLIQKRLDSMDEQEKVFSEKLKKLRDEMLASEEKK